MKIKNSVIDLDSCDQAHIEIIDENPTEATETAVKESCGVEKKCPTCQAVYKAAHSHNCFQLVFSLLSRKADKDSLRSLQSSINQKFMQLALGKKISLLDPTGSADRDAAASWKR